MTLKMALFGFAIALVADIVGFGLVPHLVERVRLTHEAAKAIEALAAHEMPAFRATPCQRKFKGIVVEGQVQSPGDGLRVETILRDAGIDANIWIVLHYEGGATERAVWRSPPSSESDSGSGSLAK